MEININEHYSNFKNDIKLIAQKCIGRKDINCRNFQNYMNDLLIEENTSLTYVAYFHESGSNTSITTNDGIIQFGGDQPNMAELECVRNFGGSLAKYYKEYEEFLKCFHSEFDINDEDIEDSFEDAFKDFIQDLFVTISNSSDISIDCNNN